MFLLFFLFLQLSTTFSFKLSPIIKKSSTHANPLSMVKNYSPYGRRYYEEYLKRLNSKNSTTQNQAILNEKQNFDNELQDFLNYFNNITDGMFNNNKTKESSVYLLPKNNKMVIKLKQNPYYDEENEEENENSFFPIYDDNGKPIDIFNRGSRKNKKTNQKSENFEVIFKSNFTFKDIGGYENIKLELSQCVDLLVDYKKYSKYNVRIPKGLILEGPPGNGKTLLAKGFAGEAQTAFIPVSGAQFQEKYVGVGSTRVRELFELAKKNTPCIIFIDEIDAIGRRRSSDGEGSTSERDNTLNELLVSLDGFNTGSGIFLMGATNRIDLLDPALIRPGRIDKKIFIGPPDSNTRECIIKIHLKGKPHDKSINIKDLVDLTAGLSGSQIENLLNEAMLNALRYNRYLMEHKDIDTVINKIMVGWQPTEHQFSVDLIERICIHEMGHAIVGYLSKHHSKVNKVIINLSAPNSPGYTMFESSTSNIYTRESLFEHLMILLAGRIAEEEFYDVSVTTGALNDFSEAFKLAEKMIIYYGMGSNLIYPSSSDKYKQIIDDEVIKLINDAYIMARMFVKKSNKLIAECADILKTEKLLKIDRLTEIIEKKYPDIRDLKNNK